MKYLQFLFITALIFLAGCTDLKEDTTGLVSPSTFYTTTEELNSGVAAIYRQYMEYYLNAQGGLPTMGGDDVTAREGLNKGPYREFDQFGHTESNVWLIQHTWDRLFQVIYHANPVINNYTNAPETPEREQIAAEARFLRGWAYFSLVRTFGEIPIYTDTPTGEEARSPVSEVYDLIISDMTFAVDNLPTNWAGAPGRVSQWAAKLYLSKVYLTMAGWPLNRQELASQAASLAKDVVDNSGFELLPNFNDLWLISNNNNKESILAIQACTSCGDWALTNRMPLSVGPSDVDGGATGWDDYFAEVAFFEEFPEGPRKEATFRTVISTPNGPIDWTQSTTKHPYYLKVTGNTPSTGWQTNFNSYVMRYAEALLTFAEAQAMSSGSPSEDAYEALNMVRRRAAGIDPNTPDASVDLSGLSAGDFISAVLDESGWEFAAEWHRWFNLVRTQTVAEATAKRKTSQELPLIGVSVGDPESAFEKFYYAPIPQAEMILRPDWEQNPCCR